MHDTGFFSTISIDIRLSQYQTDQLCSNSYLAGSLLVSLRSTTAACTMQIGVVTYPASVQNRRVVNRRAQAFQTELRISIHHGLSL